MPRPVTSSPGPKRHTRQRTAVAEVLDDLAEFRTAQEVHDLLRHRGQGVGLATVYRNLQSMADDGDVDVVRTPDGQAAYRRCAEHHHHHLICRVCGRAVEVEFPNFEALVSKLAAAHGFTAVDHELELYGLCADHGSADDAPRAGPPAGRGV